MVKRMSSIALVAARIGAVGLALAVLAYLVVDAQNSANARVSATQSAPHPALVDASVAAGAGGPVAAGVESPGSPANLSDVLPTLEASPSVDPNLIAPGDSSAFLYGSKSMVISDRPWGVATEITPAAPATDGAVAPGIPAEPVFLPSSKVGAVEPILRAPSVADPKVAPVEPVFLPSSKVLTLKPPARIPPVAPDSAAPSVPSPIKPKPR